MKFVTFEGNLPARKRMGPVQAYLTEFMNMNVKAVKVEFREDEYKSARYCMTSFWKSARSGCFPIDVRLRNGEVYLVRRDM